MDSFDGVRAHLDKYFTVRRRERQAWADVETIGVLTREWQQNPISGLAPIYLDIVKKDLRAADDAARKAHTLALSAVVACDIVPYGPWLEMLARHARLVEETLAEK